MRYLVCLLSFLFVNSNALTLSASAADPIAVFWANDFGTRLTRIKSSPDLLKQLNFSGSNASIVQGEIANKKINIPTFSYKVYITQIFMIDENKKRTIIDFEHYNNKRLLLNGKSISLRPTKTYNDYLVEVDKILRQTDKKKTSLINLIAPEAYAQSDNGIGSFFAAFFSSASDTRHFDLPQANNLEKKNEKNKDKVAQALIEAYALEAERGKGMAARGLNSDYISTMFWCEGGVLTRATEVTVKKNDTYVRKDGRSITSIPGGGYRFNYGPNMSADAAERSKTISCAAMVDDNGLVMEVSGRNQNLCPAKDLNIFNDPSYLGAFPKIARLCCQNRGCYEKVMAKRDEIIGKSAPVIQTYEQRAEELQDNSDNLDEFDDEGIE